MGVEEVARELRRRARECRRANAPLSAWRDLQIQILQAAKQERRRTMALWNKLDDAFWVESDPTVLESMIEDVITHLEVQKA